MKGLGADLVFVLRRLGRTRGFAIAIIATIGLGAGANLSVLTVIDRLLFRAPSGIENPRALRRVWVTQQRWGLPSATNAVFSFPDFEALAVSAGGLGRAAAYAIDDGTVGEARRRVATSYVSPGFLELVGTRRHLGRFLASTHDASGAEFEAVLGYRFWAGALGADSTVVGRTLTLDSETIRIVGIAARNFEGVGLDAIDVWLHLRNRTRGGTTIWTDANAQWLSLLVRVTGDEDDKPLTTRLTTAYRRLHRGESWTDPRATVHLGPLQVARQPGALLPLEERNLTLAKRLAIVSLAVLVVAIMNCAAMFLLRAIRERRALAIQLALGMSRLRLLRQVLLELSVLAVCVSMFSMIVTAWATHALQVGLLSTVTAEPQALDMRAVLFVALVAAASTFVAGLMAVPLYFGTHTSVVSSTAAVSPGRTDARIRGTTVILQTALSVALLVLAVAFTVSSRRAVEANDVYDGARLTAIVSRSVRPADIERVLIAARSLPFVEAVSNAASDIQPGRSVLRLPRQPETGASATVSFNAVDTAYFDVTRISAKRGRTFVHSDASSRVVVVSEAAATLLWPERDPIGQCAYVFDPTVCWTVIGIVNDIRWHLGMPAIPHLYVPLSQSGAGVGRVVLVRTRMAPSDQQLAQLDRVASGGNQGNIVSIYRVSDRFDRQLRPLTSASTLLLAYAGLVLVTAVFGMYSRVSYEVTQRSRELGIRAALGASPLRLMVLVADSGLKLVCLGLAGGILLATAVAAIATRFLFETSALEVPIVVSVVVALFLASAAATLVAARQVLAHPPTEALRTS